MAYVKVSFFSIKYLSNVYFFLFFFCSPPRNKDKLHLPVVPNEFIKILRGTLAKMAGEGIFPNSFIGLQFWSRFPRKFNSKKEYEDSKEKTPRKRENPIPMKQVEKVPDVKVKKKFLLSLYYICQKK